MTVAASAIALIQSDGDMRCEDADRGAVPVALINAVGAG